MAERQSGTAPRLDDPSTLTAGMAAVLMPWSVSTRITSAWLEGVTRINCEWSRFVSERLAQDAQVQHDLFNCSSPGEAHQLGTAFVHRAMNDYLAEAARLSAMGGKLADDCDPEA